MTPLLVAAAPLLSVFDVIRPDEVPPIDIAAGPLDGGIGTVGNALIVAAVLLGGLLYFRRRQKS